MTNSPDILSNTFPDTPQRRLLLDFIADEADALQRGEQGGFWPDNHHLISPLIGKAGKFLDEDEHVAFFHHLLRLEAEEDARWAADDAEDKDKDESGDWEY